MATSTIKQQSMANALKGIEVKHITGNISDTTFGFIDTGLSASDYLIIGYFVPFDSNIYLNISNFDTGTKNYRVQMVNATDNSVIKTSGFGYHIYLVTIQRSLVTE